MKLINSKKFLILVSAVFMLVLAGVGYYNNNPWVEKTECITILHTNDIHGRLEPFQYKEKPELVGGLAGRATLIKRIEGANKCVLTVDAGDFAQGSVFFNVFNGVPDAQLMSEVGYDVGTLGNHEFDKGLTFLKDIVEHAKYPIVSANIKFADEELSVRIKPYIIQDCHGLKIAVIGLVPEDLKELATVEYAEIYDTVETVKNIVKKINSKADLIVVLSHIGLENDIELAKSVPEVDVIVGGHSHTLLKQPKVYNKNDDKTLVVQAGELGVYLGRLDIKIKDKEVENYYYELIPINEETAQDRAIKNKIAILSDQMGEYTDEIIGQLAVPLGVEGNKIRSKLLPAGALVTEAIKNKFNDVDIVLQNSGGIRPYKHLGPGAVTVADIIRLFPFDNTIVILDLKGEDLKSVLETSAGLFPDGDNGGFLQSLGLEYTIDKAKAKGNRISGVIINGKRLKLDEYYKIALNNYMFSGGNGYFQFKNAKNVEDTDMKVRDAIISYIRENSPVTVDVQDSINFAGE